MSGLTMPLLILGKKADLVIPQSVREEVGIEGGDVIEVVAVRKGEVLIRKADDLPGVRKMVSGRLPQWDELEGQADRELGREAGGREDAPDRD